ncbi:MAG: type 1 glutamine amidotransferase [Acidimicrobiales bacterium]
MSLVVAVLLPDLLGTYGDGGNGVVLARRAAWRGIDTDLVEVSSGTPVPTADVYCLGGGEDGPEVRAAAILAEDGALARAHERGAAVLAVCAGFQVAGRTFPGADGRRHEGLGLLDVATTKGPGPRAVGELVADPAVPGLPPLTGFENHGGATTLGPGARPLGRVVVGVGNGAGEGIEGAVGERVVGTYLHGPVLARNPALADLLLGWAVGTELAPLDDAEESALRSERLAAASRRGRAWRSWRSWLR